jgi:DNA primase
MALPPGFLDELRARVPISDVVGRRVTWDRRRSSPAKGDFWACCPFHEEKSPSFHVDDRKGFYHCFGCHAKGDAIAFLRERENMSFMEAVEALAQMAGLPMPAQDPRAAERADERRDLAAAMEAAVAFYRAQLRGARAAEARAYLDRRGLRRETIERFEIGYAPPDRRALAEHLAAKGIDAAAALTAGLTARPEDGGAPYDRFRDRIIFPIRDARGACIAFGGRAMSAEARAKYLNSPETPLFDKSRTLYNIGPARAAAAKAGTLVAAEGYTDVIALVEAGIEHAVAPLGTAVTEAHLQAMWRAVDEPVLALDGDKAGLAAAMRAADVALPLLAPGKSLRFALLPPGRDPDEVIRAEGAAAMRAILDAAEPMVDLLWRRETEGAALDTPERRAAFDARLRAMLKTISDPSVREHYRAAFAERRAALFPPAGGARARRDWGRGREGRTAPQGLRPETRALAAGRVVGDGARARAAEILLALINHPDLLDGFGEEVAGLDFPDAALEAARRAVIEASLLDPEDRAAHLAAAAPSDLRRALEGDMPPTRRGFASPDATPEHAAAGLRDALDLHASMTQRRRALEEECLAEPEDAERAYLRAMRLLNADSAPAAKGADAEIDPAELISTNLTQYLSSKRGRK